ncbi:MAG TPA: Smr/MutS family protein [Polyangiaceae bacterium]|nr:Smr/MutS family protein [Polyangiaceae bacterium]
MDSVTLRALEWPLLLERLAARTASRAAGERLRATEPAATLEAARALAARTRDAVALDALGEALPLRDFPDVSDALARATKGGTLAGVDLVGVARVLEVARAVRVFGQERAERFPALAAAVTSEPRLDALGAALERSLEPDGGVSDAASPALREARLRVREARDALKERLEGCLKTHAEVLQGRYYTERDGRYVLPVRSDAHLRVEGIVLGSSASGGTLFVEPREATEHGNRLKLRIAAVEREEERVLSELTRAVAAETSAIARALEAAIEADRLEALALYARAARAEVLEPNEDLAIELTDVRHPLLVASGIHVVENDVRVRGGRALVISGPNAGGKTVALKCLGLAAWMARSGIPIPCDARSRVGWFTEVLADVGDEQSLERSLSTFSAHVTRLAEIVRKAGPGTLVLLDEVASGTDPEEGAALAAAVLEAITKRGAAAAVTTHYERLKELAATPGPLENASVGFDFEHMEPTFRLTLGVPGPSSALAVAARFGLDQAVLARAHELLPDRALEREQAVKRLEQERLVLERERAELRGELALAQAARADIERERERTLAQANTELGREARELVSVVRAARADVREARERLRREGRDETAVRDAERAVSRAATHVALGGTLERHAAAEERRGKTAMAEAPLALAAGTEVRLKKTGTLAVVEAPPERGSVRLRSGAVRLTLPLAEIELAKGRPRPNAPKAAPRARARAVTLPAAVRTASNTLDLRGTRVDEALTRLDAFLDVMMGEGEPLGFVLHGHGTGAMKSAVREHLGASSYVEQSRAAEADEGGDAFTVFWMRE